MFSSLIYSVVENLERSADMNYEINAVELNRRVSEKFTVWMFKEAKENALKNGRTEITLKDMPYMMPGRP
jgi:histone H3/H4